MTLEQQIIDAEKSLAGYGKTHYMVEVIAERIAQLKAKLEERQSDFRYATFDVSLQKKIELERKSLAGYGAQHYMVGVVTERIEKLQERIDAEKKNERLI